MDTLKFKTSIMCGGCIATVTPILNSYPGIGKWEVDIQNPDKVLTIEADNIDVNDVIADLSKAGYKAEKI